MHSMRGKDVERWLQGTNLSPEEITRLNMDKSALLQQLVQEYNGEPLMLLGELQVICHCTVSSGLEQGCGTRAS